MSNQAEIWRQVYEQTMKIEEARKVFEKEKRIQEIKNRMNKIGR